MTDQIATGLVTLGDKFSDHRVKGYVTHALNKGIDPKLDAPLIQHVEGGLYQGGCLDHGDAEQPLRLPDQFDYVLSLYPWGMQYELPEGCERDIVTMYDSLDQGLDQVEELAWNLAERLGKGQVCLVHCQAGLNRSGLVTARTLMLRGHTADAAIALLRAKRSPLVLCNDTFERWLRSL